MKSKDLKSEAKRIRKKYGKDPMFRLLDAHLWVSLEGLAKKQRGLIKDNTGYVLKRMREMGFEVTQTKKPNRITFCRSESGK